MTAPRRALVVIDVQNEYVTGNLLIEYPDVHASLANIGRAMDTARAAGIPVVVVQQGGPAASPIFAQGSHGAALHPVVASRPHDHLIEKLLPSAFAGTDFAAWIAAHRIDTLTVVGFMTHNCVDATLRDAAHAGLKGEFLHDAAGSVPYANSAGQANAETIHRTFCVVMETRFAAVLSTDDWIAAIESGRVPERDNIYASNQRARQAARSAA